MQPIATRRSTSLLCCISPSEGTPSCLPGFKRSISLPFWTGPVLPETGRLMCFEATMCVSEPLSRVLCFCIWLQMRALCVHGIYYKKNNYICIYTQERKVNGSLLARCIFFCLWGPTKDLFGGAAGRTITGSFYPKWRKSKFSGSLLSGQALPCSLGSPRDRLVQTAAWLDSCLLTGAAAPAWVFCIWQSLFFISYPKPHKNPLPFHFTFLPW